MLKKGVIPPQATITPEAKLHPGFADLDMSSVRIDTKPAMLENGKAKILVNSFDAAVRHNDPNLFIKTCYAYNDV